MRVNEFYNGLRFIYPYDSFWLEFHATGKQSIPMGMVYYFDVTLSPELAAQGLDLTDLARAFDCMIETNSPLRFIYTNGKLTALVRDTNGVHVSFYAIHEVRNTYATKYGCFREPGEDIPYFVRFDGDRNIIESTPKTIPAAFSRKL